MAHLKLCVLRPAGSHRSVFLPARLPQQKTTKLTDHPVCWLVMTSTSSGRMCVCVCVWLNPNKQHWISIMHFLILSNLRKKSFFYVSGRELCVLLKEGDIYYPQHTVIHTLKHTPTHPAKWLPFNKGFLIIFHWFQGSVNLNQRSR